MVLRVTVESVRGGKRESSPRPQHNRPSARPTMRPTRKFCLRSPRRGGSKTKIGMSLRVKSGLRIIEKKGSIITSIKGPRTVLLLTRSNRTSRVSTVAAILRPTSWNSTTFAAKKDSTSARWRTTVENACSPRSKNVNWCVVCVIASEATHEDRTRRHRGSSSSARGSTRSKTARVWTAALCSLLRRWVLIISEALKSQASPKCGLGAGRRSLLKLPSVSWSVPTVTVNAQCLA